MDTSIKTALAEGRKGFHIGHRLILPFRCQLLKLIADHEIFTEFIGGDHIKISQDPLNTSVYFRTIGKLRNNVGSYQHIKIIACDWNADLCEISNHIKLICELKDNHEVIINEPGDDILFIE